MPLGVATFAKKWTSTLSGKETDPQHSEKIRIARYIFGQS